MSTFWRENRRAILGLLVIGVAIVALVWEGAALRQVYDHFLQVRDSHSLLFVAGFVLLFVVAALTSVFPASLLGVGAGAAFGFFSGLALSTLALTLAAAIAFLLGRSFFRDSSRRLAARIFDVDAMERKIECQGWRYALVIRAAPLAPFGITSYAFGLTSIRFWPYLVSTVGALPFLGACVYFGSIGQMAQVSSSGHLLWKLPLLLTLGVVAVVVARKVWPKLVSRWARD